MISAHDLAVAAELKKKCQPCCEHTDAEILRYTEGTLTRALAELAVACRAVALPTVKQLESACVRLEGWLRRLRG